MKKFSRRGAAAHIGVSPGRLKGLEDRGQAPRHIAVGNARIYTDVWCDEWMRAHTVGGAA